MADPIRIPLVEDVEPRLSDSSKDGLASNVFYDKSKAGQTYATKRSGITSYISGTGQASGIYGWNNQLFIFDNLVNWVDIIWTGTTFCAISSAVSVYNNSNMSIVSTDGLTWRQGLLPSENFWTGISWNGTVFCAIGETSISGVSVIATSTDGLTWTSRTPPSGSYENISSNGSNFVIVGFASSTPYAAYSSDNGITWITASIGSTSWRDVAYCSGAGLFCAVRQGNSVSTSPTGSTWTSRSITTGDRYSITASPNLFFTPTRNSAIGHISSDGINWTVVTLPAARNWKFSCWTGSQFLCLDFSEGYVAYSSDGINWSETQINIPFANFTDPSCISGNSDIIVVLGNGSEAMQTYYYSQDSSLSYVKSNSGVNFPFPTVQT